MLCRRTSGRSSSMDFHPGRLTGAQYAARRNVTIAAALAGCAPSAFPGLWRTSPAPALCGKRVVFSVADATCPPRRLVGSEAYQVYAERQQRQQQQADSRRARRNLAATLAAALAVVGVLAFAGPCLLWPGGTPAGAQPPSPPPSRAPYGAGGMDLALAPVLPVLPLLPSSAPGAARGAELYPEPLSGPNAAAHLVLAALPTLPTRSPAHSAQLALPAANPAPVLGAQPGARAPKPSQLGYPWIPDAEAPLLRQGTASVGCTDWSAAGGAGSAAAPQAGQLALVSADAQPRPCTARTPRSLAKQAISAMAMAARSVGRLLAAPLRRLAALRCGLGAWPRLGHGRWMGHTGFPNAPKQHPAITALPQAALAQERGLWRNATINEVLPPLPLPPSSAPGAARGAEFYPQPLSGLNATAHLVPAAVSFLPTHPPAPSAQLALPAANPAPALRAQFGARAPKPSQLDLPWMPDAEAPLPRQGTVSVGGTDRSAAWGAGAAAAPQAGQLALVSAVAQPRPRTARTLRSLVKQAISAACRWAARSAGRLLAAPLRRLAVLRSGLGAWPRLGHEPGRWMGHAGFPNAPKQHPAITALPQAALAQERGLWRNASIAEAVPGHAAILQLFWLRPGQQHLVLAVDQLPRIHIALPASQMGRARMQPPGAGSAHEWSAAAARPAATSAGAALVAVAPRSAQLGFCPAPARAYCMLRRSDSAPMLVGRARLEWLWFAGGCLAGACTAALVCAVTAWLLFSGTPDGSGGQQTPCAACAARGGAASNTRKQASPRKEVCAC